MVPAIHRDIYASALIVNAGSDGIGQDVFKAPLILCQADGGPTLKEHLVCLIVRVGYLADLARENLAGGRTVFEFDPGVNGNLVAC
jgi:hypothetical protein